MAKKNEQMPDFKQLNDRLIANPTDEPTLVIKTNLDPKDPTEDNPYYSHNTDKEKFNDYFEEETK